MTARTWKCRSCLSVNGSRKRKCEACGRKRPVRRRPAHMTALKLAYEVYVALNGGDFCGISTCRRGPSAKRKLDRDHDHVTGKPRGLLCVRHNRMLDSRTSPEELRACADYLERTAEGRDGLMNETATTAEGWYGPPNSRRFHYFGRNGLHSLCGKWLVIAWSAALVNIAYGPANGDCAACKKALAADGSSGDA